MSILNITLLGGTGFVGRVLAQRLITSGASVRVVSRHAETAEGMPSGVQAIAGDVRDREVMRSVLSGSEAAVYLPGRVQGLHRRDFEEIHTLAAQNCAECARECGLERFVYLSALGVSRDAPAWSDQTKAEGERAVRRAFHGAVIVRPSLVFGPDDHFITEMLGLMKKLPVLPVIGATTRIQPVHVEDLAEGLRLCLTGSQTDLSLLQAAGPRVWRMLDLLAALHDQAKVRCRLVALPEWMAMILALPARFLPHPPLVPDQVRLMRTDKVAEHGISGLAELGVSLRDPLQPAMR